MQKNDIKHDNNMELDNSSNSRGYELKIFLGVIVFLLTIFFVFYSEFSFAADQLAGVMDEVKANFGKDSTAVKLLYGAEIIVGGYTWHKTKNPAAVTGVVVLSLFMNYALGKWVG